MLSYSKFKLVVSNSDSIAESISIAAHRKGQRVTLTSAAAAFQ